MTAAPLRIPRPAPRGRAIPLTPMIDVLLIMLVFFMVTSTYTELRMMPVITAPDPGAAPSAPPRGAVPLLIRLDAAGGLAVGAQRLEAAALGALVAARLTQVPDLRISILPAPAADTQALVTLLETLTGAGARQVRVLRLEPR